MFLVLQDYNIYLLLIKNFKKKINNWMEFPVHSIDPGWELNLGHLSDIISLDNQDFCRYCQYSFNKQKPDCFNHMNENLSLQNNG